MGGQEVTHVTQRFDSGTFTDENGNVFPLGPGTLCYTRQGGIEAREEFAPEPIDPRMEIALEIADHIMRGKGEERHGRGKSFTSQPWAYLSRTYPGFLEGQAAKKIDESMGMTPERAAKELVSAAGYIILAVLKRRGLVE